MVQGTQDAAGLQEYIWTPWDMPGSEHLRLWTSPQGERLVDSQLVVIERGKVLRVSYRIELDAAWRTRSVRIAAEQPDGNAIGLAMNGDGRGNWTDASGSALVDIEGCLDIDIQASPFTNTLPIRRLALAPEDQEVIRVAYIPVPSLDVTSMKQRYTGISHDRVRYESITSGFTRELEVDPDGIVIRYPGLFRRIWP
jgi:hypothetical protein